MKRNKYSIILTGIVISLMGCNDAKYDTAISTALGSALQHIVTKDDSQARMAIKFL